MNLQEYFDHILSMSDDEFDEYARSLGFSKDYADEMKETHKTLKSERHEKSYHESNEIE